LDVGGSSATINESEIETIVSALMPLTTPISQSEDISQALEGILDMVNIHENIKVR